MDIVSGSLCLNSTLKAPIVSAVRCICDAQIVDSFFGPVVDSVEWKRFNISSVIA